MTPSSLNWSGGIVGFESNASDVTIVNQCKTSITINSFELSPPPFILYSGWAPLTLPPRQSKLFQLKFLATAPGTFNGQLTFYVTGYSSLTIPLSGTAVISGELGSLSPCNLSFQAQPLGSVSPQQAITLTNKGPAR